MIQTRDIFLYSTVSFCLFFFFFLLQLILNIKKRSIGIGFALDLFNTYCFQDMLAACCEEIPTKINGNFAMNFTEAGISLVTSLAVSDLLILEMARMTSLIS